MAGFLSVSLRRVFSVKALSQKYLIFYRVFTTTAVNYESCDPLLLVVYNNKYLGASTNTDGTVPRNEM